MAEEIVITRVYDAPRERVWRAWTEPDELAVWWGKRGWVAQRATIVMDVRPGGTFDVTSISDEDGAIQRTTGVYREIVPPERLVFGGDAGESVVTFADLGDGRTEMTFRTVVDLPPEVRQRAEGGMRSAFERLADHLQTTTKEPA
jgi:uncharacterized protein YndB with AHSA1/START domain